MNFNHLMESRLAKRKCKARNGACYFLPLGGGRTTAGEFVHFTMHCKNCGVSCPLYTSTAAADTLRVVLGGRRTL